MSDTKYQTTGKAYGSGIYLGKNFETSLGYCSNRYAGGENWKHSMMTSKGNYSCMAIMEFVNLKDYDKGHWVVSDQNHILLR